MPADDDLRALRRSIPWMLAAGLMVMAGLVVDSVAPSRNWGLLMIGSAPAAALVGYLILKRGTRGTR